MAEECIELPHDISVGDCVEKSVDFFAFRSGFIFPMPSVPIIVVE